MKKIFYFFLPIIAIGFCVQAHAADIKVNGAAGQLDIRSAGQNAIRVTLKPLSFTEEFPYTPAVVDKYYPAPVISLKNVTGSVRKNVGNLRVEVRPNPLSIRVTTKKGELIQHIIFQEDGRLSFQLNGDEPVLGMGEGGSKPPKDVDFRTLPVEYNRRGIHDQMLPRWQADAYGSRNPVSMLIEPGNWAIFLPTPWTEVDLTANDRGYFIPWKPSEESNIPQNQRNQHNASSKGIPPVSSYVAGLFDFFVFDAREAASLMSDFYAITGKPVMPPKWTMGYMQSHRTLESEKQLHEVVSTFREKQIPVDAVIYLGTGFCPQGWNNNQPSYEFNANLIPDPVAFTKKMHDQHVKVITHVVPFDRNPTRAHPHRLVTLHGTIPAQPGEVTDSSHIQTYWKLFHEPLVKQGVDGFWPDEGDWFNLFERIKRHQLYYQGHLSTHPNVRPWSLQRNGYPGIPQWGGWVWSGDTESTWKALEAQIAVGINYSMSIGPFWGSDIGGFFTTPELTGELYARWVQFAAFTASFRGHGCSWMLRLPWIWGGSYFGPLERPVNQLPSERELFNKAIEPIARQYIEMRYRLLPYNYTLAWEARETGMPMQRAMWMHYPKDATCRRLGDQFLWGKNMLIAPVYEKAATKRDIYLPEGMWYDWWTNESHQGGRTISKEVDLAVMPIYVPAGAIVAVDPVRQYTAQKVDEPTTLKVYAGANGSFTLYDDDGISQDYLTGEGCSIIDIKWDQKRKQLSLSPAKGNTLQTTKKFIVELLPDNVKKEINYANAPVSVVF
ncbi:DUF5110 domain-containing protein [Parabacteroides sp. OttesenSCG-928-O15]|nr:DUF5110 domain-containing protein [Parabacteroides sp. OttesenSCG-928-O15]